MVLTTFRLSKPGLSPPVYIAGTFTEWQPSIEMDHDAVFGSGDQHEFSKTVDIEVGVHEYKFRLGHGDWWIVDESMPTATDDSGNVNNMIEVEESGEAEIKVSEVNSQSLPVKEVIAPKTTSSKNTVPSVGSAPSAPSDTSIPSISSAQSILRNSKESHQTSKTPDQSKDSAPLVNGSHVNGIHAKDKKKSVAKPNQSIFTKVLCCFTDKRVVGMAAVSALVVAVYMRR